MTNNKIHFTVSEIGNKQTIETTPYEYRNLMMLLKDKLLLEGFGECGGMGRCATCIVKTKGISGSSNIKNRNEPATLAKLGFVDDNTRLSCQMLVTYDLENAEIEIQDF